MNFSVAQSQKYEGNQWWRWSLWIEAPNEDLDQIESVTYVLHPTFPDPIRTITDRPSKFQLRCSGWGVFTIPGEMRLKDGRTIEFEHDLQFSFPEDSTE